MYDLIVLRVALLHLFVGQCAVPKESSGLPTKAEVKSFPFEHKQYKEWGKNVASWRFLHLFVPVFVHAFVRLCAFAYV